MGYAEELNYVTVGNLSKQVKGRKIDSVELTDDGLDDFIVFHFDDGDDLFIRYDWLYDYEIIKSDRPVVNNLMVGDDGCY